MSGKETAAQIRALTDLVRAVRDQKNLEAAALATACGARAQIRRVGEFTPREGVAARKRRLRIELR